MRLVVLLFLSVVLPVDGGSTTQTVVPDIGGMIHPPTTSTIQVRFGDLGPQYSSAYEFVAPSTDSMNCTGTQLCLALKFSSAFDMDPFFLQQYDSKYPLVSATFDIHDPSTILPLIPGNEESTVWWFQSNATATDTSTGGPVIDLLLRLRQRSQIFSAKDQFLVVVRVEVVNDRTATSVMEGYSGYGNQRVTQITHRLNANTMQMQLSITKNSQVNDVGPLDAYPLLFATAPADSNALGDSCGACDKFLDICQSTEPCQTIVLPCLISQLKALPTSSILSKSTSSSGNVEAGSAGSTSSSNGVPDEAKMSQVDIRIPLATCVAGLPPSTWVSVQQLIFCLAHSECALGTVPGSTVGEEIPTILRLTNGTQTFAVTPFNVGTDNVELTINTQDIRSSVIDLQSYSFSASASYLGMFLRSFVLLQAAQVSIEVTPYTLDPSLLRLKLRYSDALMLKSLSFSTSSGRLLTIESSPAQVLIEYSSLSTYPALETLISRLESRLIPAPGTSGAWVLAGDCLSCSSKLFKCTSEAVTNYSCSYNTAASGFGKCIHEQLPSTVYEDILAGGKDQRLVGAELNRCLNAISPGSDGLASLLDASSNLACFAAARCPFGPIALVQDAKVVVLETSSYVQLVRVLSSTAIDTDSIQIEYAVDGLVFATTPVIEASLSESEIQQTIDDALYVIRTSTVVSSSIDNNAGTEWTLEIIYHNVFLPNTFTAKAVANSASIATDSITQMMLEGGAFQLRAVPRDDTKIFKLADTASDTGSFSFSSFSSDSGSDYF